MLKFKRFNSKPYIPLIPMYIVEKNTMNTKELTEMVVKIATELVRKNVVSSTEEAVKKAKIILKELIKMAMEAKEEYLAQGYSETYAVNKAVRDVQMAVAIKRF